MLEIINLTKSYKNVDAVKDLSFTVKPGRIFGLLGPNGAGKTTTIRIILDIIKPTSGIVKFNGGTTGANLKNDIGYLPEERGLYKKSKVKDVIEYFARLKGISSQSSKNNARSLMSKLNIDQFSNCRIEELSKGNQQKVQFIIALVHDPSILILDEPFTGLDPINQQIVREIIQNFIANGRIIIISTHLLEIAENMVDDILLLNEGTKTLYGSLSEIKNSFLQNSYLINFSGNVDELKKVSGVDLGKINSNSAEIILNGISPGEFLRKSADLIDINHFSKITPTLNRIFLESVKKI